MKPLTDFMPILYAALERVSRELVGCISAVSINAAPTNAAVGEIIRIPKTNSAVAQDIIPGTPPAQKGNPDLDYLDMKITKSRMVPVTWNGEEQLGVGNSGVYPAILADQFAQGMRTLANEVEGDLVSLYVAASRGYGTPGTTPFAQGVTDSAMMRKILLDNGAPTTDLQLVVDTTAGAMLRSNTQLTKANEAGSDATLRRGEILNLNGFSIRESGQIRSHEPGTIGGTPLVNNPGGYGYHDAVIAFDGAQDVDLKAGDMVSFGEAAERYVLPADTATTPMSLAPPGLVRPAADDAAIIPTGAYVPNLAFDRNALQLLARTPAMPQGGDEADDVTVITDPVSGVSFQVAVYRGYREVRFEIGLAWGIMVAKPEHLAILIG